MEQLVGLKVEEMETRVCSGTQMSILWPLASKRRNGEKENEEKPNADEAPNVENNWTEEGETEGDVDGAEPSGISRTDAISDKLAITHLSS